MVIGRRNLEVFGADPRQLDGHAEGQKVRLRFQQQDGQQLIYGIVPVPKQTRPNLAGRPATTRRERGGPARDETPPAGGYRP